MQKKAIALTVLAVGLLGFMLMLAGESLPAFSPQLHSSALQGKVIGVDAGHGGYDGGCTGHSGSLEKEINLAVALLVQEELEKQGAVAVLSRTEDVALIDPAQTTGYKKRKELDNRLKIFADGGVECVVSIHMNQFSDQSQHGAQVFFRNGEAESENLAVALQDALLELDPENRRQANAGDYYILNACPASALVECGFLSNPQEERLLMDEAYRRKLAQAIVQGIASYFAQPQQTNTAS